MPACMGPFARVDYNLTLCPLQGRIQHVYHEKPRVNLNPMPESTLSPTQGLWIWLPKSSDVATARQGFKSVLRIRITLMRI
jgi:hypothetical protein